jgi:hypothetical protein
LFQHKPVQAPRLREALDRAALVEDERRRQRLEDAEDGIARRLPGASPSSLGTGEVTDDVIAGTAQSQFPSGVPDGPPRLGNRDAVLVEGDNEVAEHLAVAGEREPHVSHDAHRADPGVCRFRNE